MTYQTITSVQQLRALYEQPYPLVLAKERPTLDAFTRKFLELSPFSVISTGSKTGKQDSSPRGDHPGFIKALDDSTLAIPDRRGNNRLDSMINLIENPHIGISSYIPGFCEVLRIHGSAQIVTDQHLIEMFEYKSTYPKSVILVTIQGVQFHCGKALTRARLWEQDAQVDRSVMPALGRMLMLQQNPEEQEAELKRLEEYIIERTRNALY